MGWFAQDGMNMSILALIPAFQYALPETRMPSSLHWTALLRGAS
jgi:hypothetical protein